MLPRLQIGSGLSRFRGDADADVRAALAGGQVGTGVARGLLGGQEVSLPPEVGLVDLHGLARGIGAVLQVVPAPEQELSLLAVPDRQDKKTPVQLSTKWIRGQNHSPPSPSVPPPPSRPCLLRLDAAASQQLVQRAEESTGAGDGGVASFNAPLTAGLRHPVHHPAAEHKLRSPRPVRL